MGLDIVTDNINEALADVLERVHREINTTESRLAQLRETYATLGGLISPRLIEPKENGAAMNGRETVRVEIQKPDVPPVARKKRANHGKIGASRTVLLHLSTGGCTEDDLRRALRWDYKDVRDSLYYLSVKRNYIVKGLGDQYVLTDIGRKAVAWCQQHPQHPTLAGFSKNLMVA